MAWGVRFQCVYCKQGCSSREILMAHEADCPKRKIKEDEYKKEVFRHNIRIAAMKKRGEFG